MDGDISVVGIGCNFPGGEGVDNFWKVLVEGRNCAVEIPQERFNCSSWYHPDDGQPGKTQTTKAAFIDGFNEIDHKFFGITEAEADSMDPQQKLLLQCSYRAFEDAGIPLEKASGTRTGVYIGLMNRDYESLLNNSPSRITHYNGTGTAMSVAANRVSYTFNLTGPSFAIDSACSSSLVALHAACQAIRQGDCDMALCGGVSCILEPRVFVALSKAKMISPEGTSKPFSSQADGYGRGEGCGMLLLKPLKKALEDTDHVWGIISKTAVNQDGHTVTPITKPSQVQQEELLRGIYSKDSDCSHVQYIEAHGTGTPVGDPVEAGSISNVIAKVRPLRSEPLCIGSVKGNIGHTESAAGVAGLIKVLLMMKHEAIVPSLFYSEDNASIDVKVLNLRIPMKAEDWKKTCHTERIAGVNNFGFGGTNAHAVIREYKQSTPDSRLTKSRMIFVLSAASEKSLSVCISDTIKCLQTDKQVDLQTLAYTSACRRTHGKHKFRKACVTSSVSDLEAQLKSSLSKKTILSKSELKLVFVFCGNGVTYRGMCRQLMKEEPIFRQKVREVESLFQKYRSSSISRKITDDYDNDDFSKPDVIQPLLFAIQVAIANLFKHWGIKPDAVLGHSVGEVAAAHFSGLLTLEDAVKVIHYRSVLQSRVTGGKMLVVGNVLVSEVLELLQAYTGKVCLAALNSPVSCVLSGDAEAMDSLHKKLKTSLVSKNLFLHVLDVPAAYHSQMMDPILNQIKDSIGCLAVGEMECDLYSTVTGKSRSSGDFTTGDYWARNIRESVVFEQAVKSASQERKRVIFVEISPRRALQRNITEILGDETMAIPSVQPDTDHETMLNALAKLFELGFQVEWSKFYAGFEAPPTEIPRYQFDSLKKEVCFETIRQGNEVLCNSSHPLITPTKQNRKEHKCSLSPRSAPYLWEHKNHGVVIVPGALYVELAFASAMSRAKLKMPLHSVQVSVTFQNVLVLSKDAPELRVSLEPCGNKSLFRVASSSAAYASGTILYTGGQAVLEEKSICLDVLSRRCSSVIPGEMVYASLSRAGFDYGPVFRQLGEVYYGDEFREAMVTVRVPHELLEHLQDYYLHPVVLDYFLQLTAVVAVDGSCAKSVFPSSLGSVVVSGPVQEEMVIYLRVTQETSQYFEVCGCFAGHGGNVLVELKHVRISFVKERSQVAESLFFHNEVVTISEDVRVSSKPKALVFADTMGVANAMKPYLHPTSCFVSTGHFEAPQNTSDMDIGEVLFILGIQNLSQMKTDSILQHLVDYCELYRKVLLSLRHGSFTVRVITYRSSGSSADHISPGFVLSGMTRACAAEMTSISFQLIDLASVSSEDIQALSCVISSSTLYPEILINKGQVHMTSIAHCHSVDNTKRNSHSLLPQHFLLHTADPYRMTNLSAAPTNDEVGNMAEKHVEVQLNKLCVHSSDYFPVSVADLNFGQTMYWNKHTNQDHKLLALDFSGTITAIGRNVRNLNVGDHIASCYPVAASSKVVIPDSVCYKTKRLPFLSELPCVSYFVLAWEIFQCILDQVKPQQNIIIFSSVAKSCLARLLVLLATKLGWKANVQTQTKDLLQSAKNCPVLIVLPPFDESLVITATRKAAVKRVVLICDQRFPSFLSNAVYQGNDSVCIHSLSVSRVLQKANLQKQTVHVSQWLKSLRLGKSVLSIQCDTFQNDVLDKTGKPTTAYESYFNGAKVSLIVLANDCSGQRGASGISILPQPKRLFSKNSVYIVTGGLSGLGLETVKFIAQRGGQCIASLCRSVPSTEVQQELATLERRYGISVMTLQCDVSLSDHVVKAITAIEQKFPSWPVRGVFHSAAVLHDGLIETLDRTLFEKVLRPKICGVLNLHYATLQSKLEYFVCYSSISSFIGNASQANYAAANSFLDTFCHYRRNLGLAGQSINWGPLNLGLLLNKANFQRFLETKGLMTLEVSEIHEALEKCLLTNNTQQVVCRFNYLNLKKHVLSQNKSLRARLWPLVEKELKNMNVAEPGTHHLCSVDKYVRRLLSETSNVEIDELGDNTALNAIGMDSMSSMTIQNRIFQDRNVNVPLVKLLDPTTTVKKTHIDDNVHKTSRMEN
uniref:Carrier domain-containing protein n=1 Tax=Denticeps clupeoides TaxID=299321 RepID=A0AAY4A1M8_9TELE